MPEDVLASVAILTFSGEKYLNEVLEAVFNQKTSFLYEVIVIDSGSTDKTLEILTSHPVKLHRIPNSDFNHGKTRNLAAKLAKGQFVAYLTQDATPANDRWLQYLIDAFKIGPKVAAVYGLHIPRPDCDPTTKRDIEEFFAAMGPADQPTVRFIGDGAEGREEYQRNEGIIAFYSDVNSCLRKCVWEKIPYRPLEYAEDQALARDILEAGYWKVYEPRVAVIHSHRFPLHQYFQRQFDEYRGLRRSIGYVAKSSFIRVTLGTVKGSWVDWKYILRQRYSPANKLKWLTHALAMNFLRRFAAYLASKEHRLPKKVIQTISLEANTRNIGQIK